MKEKNRQTLENAVRNLPQYQPGSDLWEKLEKSLDREQEFQDAIRRLPVYDPPEELWGQIEGSLNKRRHSGIFSLTGNWRIPVAAAVAVLIVSASWLFLLPRPEKVTLIYSQEFIDESKLGNDWDQDEKMIREVLEMAAENKFTADNPKFKSLVNELEELNDAKSELNAIMDQYGKDPDFIRQLTDIEKERTEIVKQIAALI